MKVWRFYKKPKNEKTVPIEDIPDAYPLYACTQEKKYAKKLNQEVNNIVMLKKNTFITTSINNTITIWNYS